MDSAPGGAGRSGAAGRSPRNGRLKLSDGRIIFGIDPGTVVTGFGVIRVSSNGVTVLSHGTIRNRAGTPMPERLAAIFTELETVLRRFTPNEIAIETAFYGKNAQSALKLGQARGVAILSAVRSGTVPVEYSPREVKKAITGNGNASKRQVQLMVRSHLGLKETIEPHDASDAVAVAICHGRRFGFHSNGRDTGAKYSDWKDFVKNNPRRVK
jgi:crossover junction endodeoxyribonuclease RuvC